MAIPLGLGRPSQQAVRTVLGIVQRFRCWFSPEDGNPKPQHVLLKLPWILHGSHHVPRCEVFSAAAATMGGTWVSTDQAGTWDGHVTSELRQALCTQLCDTHERGSRDTDKTPQWPALQSKILAATHRAGGGRGGCICTSSSHTCG